MCVCACAHAYACIYLCIMDVSVYAGSGRYVCQYVIDISFSILSQMTGKDKDYRYMATSDLLNELSKATFRADADLEVKLKNIIIQQLDDVAGDVSGLAVKWYTFSLSSLSLILLWIIWLAMTDTAFKGYLISMHGLKMLC